jgi:hypothetical protein
MIKIKVDTIIYQTWQHYCNNAVWNSKIHLAGRTNRFYAMPRKEKNVM